MELVAWRTLFSTRSTGKRLGHLGGVTVRLDIADLLKQLQHVLARKRLPAVSIS